MRLKVLVIEDNQQVGEILRQVVDTAGFEPVMTTSLTQARYLFAEDQPETYLCAIIDYALPDARHGEAVREMLDAYIPVIVMADTDEPSVRNAMFKMPVVDYFAKGNAQVYDYISRLLTRLDKNRAVGVLVVEAIERKRRNIQQILQRYNFDVFAVNDLKKVNRMLSQYPHIRLLIVADEIAGQSGILLVEQLRQQYSKDRLAILGVAPDKSNGVSASFIKGGANDYIIEPFSVEEMLCRVQLNVDYLDVIGALSEAAHSDWLTGLSNRRHFFAQAPDFLRRFKSSQVALLDIDHFKMVNDTYGHDAGDAALKAVAGIIKQNSADGLAARMGGEEFVLLLHGEPEVIRQRLDGLRQQVESLTIRYRQQTLQCTISIGVAQIRSFELDAAIASADKRLYCAKQQGRNRVISD